MKASLGHHTFAELLGCDPRSISEVAAVRPALERAIAVSGATPLRYVLHQFTPRGVSATVLIAESHLCLHTWPESRYAAADIFTCGADMRGAAALRDLATSFGAREVVLKELERGIPR